MFAVLAKNVKHLSLSKTEEITLSVAWEDMKGWNKRGKERQGSQEMAENQELHVLRPTRLSPHLLTPSNSSPMYKPHNMLIKTDRL